MTHTISPDRKTLTIIADAEDRANLAELGDTIHQDATMHEVLEHLTCNSELEWIPDGITGDLTSAPMLGILGEDQPLAYRESFPPHYGLLTCGYDGKLLLVRPVLERWCFMSHQVRSVLEDLRDTGGAIFTN